MFLTKAELKSTIYQYQLQQITEGDDSIIDMGITAGIEEVRSYLTPNDKKEWNDGRRRYDVAAIFGATGTARNMLIVELTKTVAEWWIIRLCNADLIHEQVKERYDRAIEYLVRIATGKVTISSLPILAPPVDGSGTPTTLPFRMGGRDKFNHE